jgi:hypothetical protein
LKLPGYKRDPKPRLKPGVTYARLVMFVVGALVFSVAAEHFVSMSYPPVGDCVAKGIDSYTRNEGTCTEDNVAIVVVDRHSVLTLESLEARLLGVQDRKTIKGPAGSRTALGKFLTFDLAVTNRTGAPASIGAGQFILALGEVHGEDVEIEEGYEPHSFLKLDRTIPPNGTEDGTVTFSASAAGAKLLRTRANLDVVNLGAPVPLREPEALFSESEHGVIRTYK